MVKLYKSLNFKKVLLYLFLCFFTISYAQTDSAPVVTAQGRQIFCPENSINIVTDFTITDSDDTGIVLFFVQISSGYQINFDRLELTGNNPNIQASWNPTEGKLTLRSVINGGEMLFDDLENAVKNVVFTTTSNDVFEEKTFSLTIDDANYLPLTDHFYQFIDEQNITWSNAKIAAENRFYYGRQGYLATLTSQEEADFAGKQAAGAGWIGGSDEETEGEWKWVTGPEAGTVFWNGTANGSSPNFAFWNSGEPNQDGNEDYAHITDPSIGNRGAWNDLANVGGNGAYIPKGYIVEYGTPSDPPLNIVASTSIYIPQILSTTTDTICESGSATITANPSEGDILWFDAQSGGTQLATGSSFTTPNLSQNTTYYATISVNGCTSFPRIPVEVVVNQRPIITTTTNDLICSGAAFLNAEASNGEVYWFETLTSTTPLFIGANFQTPTLNATTSYFVEANNSNCVSNSRTEVIAVVDDTVPEFDVLQNTIALCEDIGSLELETINAQGNYSYVWKKEGVILAGDLSTITINSSGIYTVSAISEAGCESLEQTITVIDSEKATVTEDDVIITDDSNNNSIQVANTNLGNGDYEFAIDDEFGVYKDDGYFPNLTTGVHTLFVRDKGGCGTTSYFFSILAYPKFFTPNDDGDNDIWEISGFDRAFYTVSDIFIYNRFGNLVYKIEQNNRGWNGISKGKNAPSNDYWFRVTLTDINGLSIEKIGNFSLIRK